MSKKTDCEICGNSTYHEVESSILIERYPFITPKNLVECSKCGARYITCSNCGSIFNRVHLALDIFQIKEKCPKCNIKNKELSDWILNFRDHN
ncbi:hypothetical protein DSAG12_02115 [Promethearchaeum syntrophicum]|uniref:Uncharacterized protein n=1 Tax=Promethearchaeum syntrophicum TaxID=2594042 RepID=A0A5B9DBE4_9ARCH|nr:hypothetical protein [Candidatus Prometheoarchaeum syntrophicum]QEE16285.1 hypothetical protein DSAG12_02115 [Candidatus Prometheoarchaeum syntrophicum]